MRLGRHKHQRAHHLERGIVQIGFSPCPIPGTFCQYRTPAIQAWKHYTPRHGFTVAQMVEIVRAGLATAHSQRVIVGRRTIEIAHVKITEAGRQALA
jgi:hypothetical protein